MSADPSHCQNGGEGDCSGIAWIENRRAVLEHMDNFLQEGTA